MEIDYIKECGISNTSKEWDISAWNFEKYEPIIIEMIAIQALHDISSLIIENQYFISKDNKLYGLLLDDISFQYGYFRKMKKIQETRTVIHKVSNEIIFNGITWVKPDEDSCHDFSSQYLVSTSDMEKMMETLFTSLCNKKVYVEIGNYRIGFLYENNMAVLDTGEEYINFSIEKTLKKYLRVRWNLKKNKLKRDKTDPINTFDEYYKSLPLLMSYPFQYFWICIIIQLMEIDNISNDKMINLYYRIFVQLSGQLITTNKRDFIMIEDDMINKINLIFHKHVGYLNENEKIYLENITYEFIHKHMTEEYYDMKSNYNAFIRGAKKLCDCVSTEKNEAVSILKEVCFEDDEVYRNWLYSIGYHLSPFLETEEIYKIWGFRKESYSKDLLHNRRKYYSKKIKCTDKSRKRELIDKYFAYEIHVLELVTNCVYGDNEYDFAKNSGILLCSIRQSLLSQMSYSNLTIIGNEDKWIEQVEKNIDLARDLYSQFYNRIFECVYSWESSLELTDDNENWNMIAPETRKKILKKLIRK